MPAPKGNQNAKGNKGGGRKTLYRPEFAAQAAKACEAGFTDRDVAELFGVCEKTIGSWKLAHVEFATALKMGKAPADDRVEMSLYRRATGYSYDAVKIMGYEGEYTHVPYVEHAPPDTTACIFWLKNRRRQDWRDRVDVEKKTVREITSYTDDELRDIIRRASASGGNGVAGSGNGVAEPSDGSSVH